MGYKDTREDTNHRPTFFTPSHTAVLPPTQAKPAQILTASTHTHTHTSLRNLNHSLLNPAPQGKPNPSIPNHVRCTCHFWLQTQCSHQLLPQALSFIPLLLSDPREYSLSQFHLADCLSRLYGITNIFRSLSSTASWEVTFKETFWEIWLFTILPRIKTEHWLLCPCSTQTVSVQR